MRFLLLSGFVYVAGSIFSNGAALAYECENAPIKYCECEYASFGRGEHNLNLIVLDSKTGKQITKRKLREFGVGSGSWTDARDACEKGLERHPSCR